MVRVNTEAQNNAPRSGRWLVPGAVHWEVREPGSPLAAPALGTIGEIDAPAPTGIGLVALPPQAVTCQLFWLDTTDEKALPDLLAMQCERRALLRLNEVWKYRPVRQEGDRLLAQVLILGNILPRGLEVEGAACFEALPRVLELPPRSLCLWRTLRAIVVALTDETGLLYFQTLPHHSLTPGCLGDVQAVLQIAMAQGWVDTVEALVLMGEVGEEETGALSAPGLEVRRCSAPRLILPGQPMELVPASVQARRKLRQRNRQVRRAVLAVAAIYLIFIFSQIAMAITHSLRHRHLQAEFQRMLPEMTDLQNTARRLDALNPALDTGTYPMEVLRRIMALLPESGVRLTRFEIVGARVELSGESSTAREAFDFLHAIQHAEPLSHITWEEPPQPVPLPNDTTRFSIQGTLTGAYHDAEES